MVYLSTALIVLLFFVLWFFVSVQQKNYGLVDIAWGLGMSIVGVFLILMYQPDIQITLSILLIVIWGFRLGYYLFKRNWGKPEDFRYADWRKEWGKDVVIIAFFRVFMIQGIINFIVGAASYTVIKYNQFVLGSTEQYFVYLALFIAIVGLFFEVVGDEQLRRHINKRTKSLLTTGLWSITRHPNYFGEILIWVGLYLTGITLVYTQSVNLLYYALLIVSPLVMSTVLIKISTPLLEKNMEKYAGWKEYTQRVPMIFPWGKKA